MTTTSPTTSQPGPRLDNLDGYIDSIIGEANRFADAAEAGSLGVPILACPGWTMRQLIEHLGSVHLWAAANVAFPSSSWISAKQPADLKPYWPDLAIEAVDDELIDWYRATVGRLVEVIRSSPLDHECLTFLPAPSPLIMWARRQASELAVHRHDAEAARDIETNYETSFALDMLDELLTGFAPKMRPSAEIGSYVLNVTFDEVDYGFVITVDPTGVRTVVSNELDPPTLDVDAHLSGSAADLYLLLWNRPAGSTVRIYGDPKVLELWAETCRIQWR